MDNKNYIYFLTKFKEISSKIDNCEKPLDAIAIAENNLSCLFSLFIKSKEYLKKTNLLINEERINLQDKIKNEISIAYSLIGDKIRKFEDYPRSFHWDKGMESVFNSYYDFLILTKKEFESIPDYTSKNPDFILTQDKIRLRTNSDQQYNWNLEEFRGITFKNDEFIHHFHDLLKQRVARNNRFILLKLLEGENINGKIKFSGHQKLLCYYFNYPLVHGLITFNRDELIDWLIRNFEYVVKGESKPVLFKSIKNYIVTNIKLLPERVKNKDEIIELVDSYLIENKE